ncbi:hypothetical protein AA313_de0202306 [Arthrobotrys entomopaga]|nr:hypothetical protein AA313_de0202306 [Arthrobotrys entomopaga]
MLDTTTDQAATLGTAPTAPTIEQTVTLGNDALPRVTPRRPILISRNPNPPISKIEDGLYLGDGQSSYKRDILTEYKISAVVSVTVGRWFHWGMPWYYELIPEGQHIYVPTKDTMTHDLLPDLARICDHIDKYRAGEITPGNVLVHCEQGISRSSTAVIAYLKRSHKWSFPDALAFVKTKRRIRPNENFREQLQVWEAVEYKIWEEGHEGEVPKPEYAAYLEKRAARLKEAGLTGNEPVEILNLEDM